MGIRQKLMLLSIMAGLVVLFLSVFGYFQAYKNLRSSTEQELAVEVKGQADVFDGWLREKQKIAIAEANLMAVLSARQDMGNLQENLSLHKGDPDILNVAYGDETGLFCASLAGLHQGVDVHTRPWYQALMRDPKPSFTLPYEGFSTKQMIVSAIAPFQDAEGAFAGGICVDVSLNAVVGRIQAMHYHDAGDGFLFDSKGGMIASSVTDYPIGKNLRDMSAFASHAEEIMEREAGVFSVNGGNMVAYARVPSTGWVVCLTVPEMVVFAQLSRLRISYGAMTLVGLLVAALIFFLCTRFARNITGSVTAIEAHAREIAKGNLAVGRLKVRSRDEVGSLTESFNTMTHDLHGLVGTLSEASREVADASGDLRSHVEMSAQAAKKITERSGEVSGSMAQQMENIMAMLSRVDTAFADMDVLCGKISGLVESIAALEESAALLRQDTWDALSLLVPEENPEENEGVCAIGQCFEVLSSQMADLRQQAKEVHSMAQSVQDDTGHVVDTVGAMDEISRNTTQTAKRIENATKEQEASILEIVAATESMEALAADMRDVIERFRL